MKVNIKRHTGLQKITKIMAKQYPYDSENVQQYGKIFDVAHNENKRFYICEVCTQLQKLETKYFKYVLM